MDCKCRDQDVAVVVHVAQMHGGAMANVKSVPSFTAKRTPGCSSDVLQNLLETNSNLKVAMMPPNGEDTHHLFEYTAPTVDSEGGQETVYLEHLQEGLLDLCSVAPQGAARKKHTVACTLATQAFRIR